MGTLFRNTAEGRLRAGWRLLLFHLLLLVLTLTVGIVAGLVTLGLPWGSVQLAILQAAVALAWVAALAIGGRFLDHRPLSDFGFHLDRGWWLDLAFGLALGALLMTGIFLVELAAGWIEITGTLRTTGYGEGDPFSVAIIAIAVFMIAVGVGEEVWTRGYLIRNLSEGLGPRRFGARSAVVGALVLSSLVFAALHLANPNASLLGAANLVVVSVLLLGGSYVLTGELAIPIGFHISWNFVQGSVFGFPVSGLEGLAATFIQIEQSGPELWTGGAFGPEGGLLGLAAILAGTALMAAWVRARRGRVAIEQRLAQYQPVPRRDDRHDG